MRVSLNEIMTLAERAARGAGATPGADTEAGRHAAWLEGHGLPALAPMAASLGRGPAVLEARAGAVDLADASLVFHAGALIDLAVARAAEGAPGLVARAARDPLFLVAAAARFAEAGLALAIGWGDAGARLGADGGLALHGGSVQALAPAGAGDVAVVVGPAPAFPPLLFDGRALDRRWRRAVAAGVEADDATLDVLHGYARRTYVPASALSRSRGAGAEVDDSA